MEQDSDGVPLHLLSMFGLITATSIAAVNLPVIWVVKKESKLTLINQLVGLDCLLCLSHIPIVLYTTNVFGLFASSSLCSLRVFYTFFITMLNRLLPVGIVFYRYVYVCRSSWVLSAQQRKNLNILIFTVILAFTILLSLCSIIFKEKYLHYLECIGQGEDFTGIQTNINLVWGLSLFHPFHLLSILTFFSHTLLVPLGYILIYAFRRNQNTETIGLNESSRIARKNRNIVTTKFNLLIWLSEASSFFVLVPNGKTFYILYFLISSCVSPMLYYIGIEVNRQAVRQHLKELFKESKKEDIGAAPRRTLA